MKKMIVLLIVLVVAIGSTPAEAGIFKSRTEKKIKVKRRRAPKIYTVVPRRMTGEHLQRMKCI